MSRRKVVTEITIETNQVLVIKRRQVTRSRCSECASEAEFGWPDFVRPDRVNVMVDEAGIQQGVEASSSTRRCNDAADGSLAIYLRSLLGATTLAKGIFNCLRRGSKRERRQE